MEIYELRYFLAVAKTQNIHRASEDIHISPASLSKAISRLEKELSVSLFKKSGRGIELTTQGALLQSRASKIVMLEESAKLEISGGISKLNVEISGEEVVLSHFGVEVAKLLLQISNGPSIQFSTSSDSDALLELERGEVQLALTTYDVPKSFSSKVIGKSEFQTVVGLGHPLYSRAANNKIIEIEEILKYPFVILSNPRFGKVTSTQSNDGWRDDKFLRKKVYSCQGVTPALELVSRGLALAYFPDYLVKKSNLKILKISGCPYHCRQEIKLVASDHREFSWVRSLFDLIK